MIKNSIYSIINFEESDDSEKHSSVGTEKETSEVAEVKNENVQDDMTLESTTDDINDDAIAENIDDNINEDDLQYAEVGKEVKFGVYTIDYSTQPIKRDYISWIILGKEGENVLLVSKDVLFISPYNETFDEVGWEDSSLNQELQTSIFSKNEYEKLVCFNESENNDDNCVFILDGEQIKKYLNDDIIIANASDYLLETDVIHSGTACAYWVRDDDTEFGAGWTKPIITPSGRYSDDYSSNIYDVNRTDIGVRPAIYLKEDFVEELLQSEYYWQINSRSNYKFFINNDEFTLLTNDFLSTNTLPTYSDDIWYVYLYSDNLHTNDIKSYSTIYHYAVFEKNN